MKEIKPIESKKTFDIPRDLWEEVEQSGTVLLCRTDGETNHYYTIIKGLPDEPKN